jgi:hypothetical protein
LAFSLTAKRINGYLLVFIFAKQKWLYVPRGRGLGVDGNLKFEDVTAYSTAVRIRLQPSSSFSRRITINLAFSCIDKMPLWSFRSSGVSST